MNILLIVTGSIAAYKALEVASALKKYNVTVRCVLTKSAAQFVTPLSLSAISGEECFTEDTHKMEHISLERPADLILICPATADFIGKAANGIGGELALDLILAKRQETKALICPAMNSQMFMNPIVQGNLKKLEKLSFKVISPDSGTLACGETGIGKLASVERVCEGALKYLGIQTKVKSCKNQSLWRRVFCRKGMEFFGKTVVITTGSTMEKIDDVRCITNFSSGTQGCEIANELLKRGANVVLIKGGTSCALPRCKIIRVQTADEMLEACLQNIGCDIFISVAAVCDFKIKNKVIGKIKKQNGLQLEFEPNPDILHTISTHQNRPQIVMGFAAEAENVLQHGIEKLERKNCNLLFANDLCFGDRETNGFLINKNLTHTHINGSKRDVAIKIVDKIAEACNQSSKNTAI